MKIHDSESYMRSLREIFPIIYYRGKRIEDVTKDPATAAHVRAAAMTYALANNEEYKDLATATSHLTGHTISRFTHVHQNIEDLMKKVKWFYRKAIKLGGKAVFPEPIVNLKWDYTTGGKFDSTKMAKEINGYFQKDVTVRGKSFKKGDLVPSFAYLLADGSTSSANWLY